MTEHHTNYESTVLEDSPLRQNSNLSHMARYKSMCGISTTVPFLVFTMTQSVQRSSSFAMHFTVLKLLGFVSAPLHITGWVERLASIICLWLSTKPQSLFIVITQLNIILVLEWVCYHAEAMLSSWFVTVCGSKIDVMPPTPFTPPDDLVICTSHQITPHHFKWI